MNKPTPLHRYRLARNAPSARFCRALAATGRLLARCRHGLYGLAIGALWVYAMTTDYTEQVEQERDRAEAKAMAIADWHQRQNVRVTLEGSRAQVSNLANQIAAEVRP